jgi:predicted esterase
MLRRVLPRRGDRDGSQLWLRIAALTCCLVPWQSGTLYATKLVLDNGFTIEGRVTEIRSLSDDLQGTTEDGRPNPRQIILCDDQLRRMFVSQRRVQNLLEADSGEVLEMFNLRQRTAKAGRRVQNVGQVLKISDFSEFGRRIFEMNTPKGSVEVVQGITELTPYWTKVEGMSHVWDQRIATSSISTEKLDSIFARLIEDDDVGQRLRVARFYLQGERYVAARRVLEEIQKDLDTYPEQVDEFLVGLKQITARRYLTELKMRREAGQHLLVLQGLEQFPSDGIAGEILQAVREMQDEYTAKREAGDEVFALLKQHTATIEDPDLSRRLEPFQQEIQTELSYNTLDRMNVYRRLSTDVEISSESKLALALSGWVAGADEATENLPVALSMLRIRDLIRDFLSEETKNRRDQLLETIAAQEGATPPIVARILDHMRPPLGLPERQAGMPGLYRIEVAGYEDDPSFEYLVQLPPQYDPYRRYPAVVTLHGAGSTPELQIDWWSGSADEQGARAGQATRHGYIVIAPAWGSVGQKKYGYSARSHAAVLNSLRDAMRRLSIDTDRIFLSGHSMGADAAWDIGLSHPDLWAGVMPICGVVDRYGIHYWENARYVPFYCVGGELDGVKALHNASHLDKYLQYGFPTQVVEYRGRGHEHFSDEIQHLFDWMSRERRNFFPDEFECSMMRTWDNFFWWVEMDELPAGSMVHPSAWPPKRGSRFLKVKAKRTANNGLHVQCAADQVTLWLSPELIDMNQPTKITVNGRQLRGTNDGVSANVAVILEDARTRGDRKHPFWAKIEMPEGRINELAGPLRKISR